MLSVGLKVINKVIKKEGVFAQSDSLVMASAGFRSLLFVHLP